MNFAQETFSITSQPDKLPVMEVGRSLPLSLSSQNYAINTAGTLSLRFTKALRLQELVDQITPENDHDLKFGDESFGDEEW